MAPAGSQQLRAQDPVPARRCGTEGRREHEGWKEGNDDRNTGGGGDGREDEYGDEHEGSDGGENGSGNGSGNGRENGNEKINEGGGEREPGNLRSGNRGGSEDVRRWAKPTNE